MPQLDSSTFVSQLFWMTIFFCTILLFSTRYSLPRLIEILQTRWQLIQGRKQSAANMREEADKIVESFTRELEAIRKRSHEQIIETAKLISLEQARHKKELAQQFKVKYQEHELRLAHKKAQAMGDVQTIAGDLAATIAQGIIGQPSSSQILSETVQASSEQES